MEDKTVLIIDDDQNICQILEEYLTIEDFEVLIAHDGKEGLDLTNDQEPDIIILDIMLPEVDGWQVCKQIRQSVQDIPIIMLSAKTEETDKITGLELGADDYVTKPFSPKEVVARVKAVLRRFENKEEDKTQSGEFLSFPKLKIDKSARKVEVDGSNVSLTPKEFDLLWTLAFNAKTVFSRDKLLNKIWGYDYFGDSRTVDTHIKSLRNKLESPVQDYIQTVWGVGYKFEVKED